MASPTPTFESIDDSSLHEEQIRRRAYELYLSRGDQPGSAADDWLQAEGELRPAEDKAAAE